MIFFRQAIALSRGIEPERLMLWLYGQCTVGLFTEETKIKNF